MDGRSIRDVPSTVHMDEAVAGTPKSSNRKLMKLMKNAPGGGASEVDAYENPTELFQWINYGNFQSAAVHALEHPVEARTWIVSRKMGKKGEQIKWKYLPLHLVCMKPNPSEDLVRALIYTFPEAARERDNDGNLSIHYLLAAGCDRRDILQMLLKAYPESVDKRDRKGRSLLEIVSEGYRSGKLPKETMVNMLAILRQWTTNEDRSVSGNMSSVQRQRGGGSEARDAAPPPERLTFDFEVKDQQQSSHARRSQSRSKRSVSRGNRRAEHSEADIVNLGQHERKDKKVSSRDGLEMRLEDTLTERDFLRKTVAALKSETKTQEMALGALLKQVNDSTHEQQRGKEKLKKKKDRIEELLVEVKEKDQRLGNQQKIYYDKEQKVVGQDKQLREMSEKMVRLVEQNDMLKGNSTNQEGENVLLASNLDHIQEEKEGLKIQIDDLLKLQAEANAEKDASQRRTKELEESLRRIGQSQTEDDAEKDALQLRTKELEESLHRAGQSRAEDDAEKYALQLRTKELEESLRRMGQSQAASDAEKYALQQRTKELEESLRRIDQSQNESNAEKQALQLRTKELEENLRRMQESAGGLNANETLLKSRIAALERDVREGLRTDIDGNYVKGPDVNVVVEERDALKEMNASLQEHVGALKERCRYLEEDGSEKDELEQQINKLESDLLHARMKQTEYHEHLEQVKSDSLIHESRLQTKLARLEKDLLEAQRAKETASKHLSPSGSDDDKSLEGRHSLQMINASLQEHIFALKDKCSALETSLEEVREKNAALSEELQTVKFDDIGDRQKELHSEFQHLFSMVQGMAIPKVEGSGVKDLGKLQTENEVLRIETSSLKARFGTSQSEIATLNKELHGVRSELKAMKVIAAEAGSALDVAAITQDTLLLEREMKNLRIQAESAKKESTEDIENLEVQLQESSKRADMYKEQLFELEDKVESVKSSNSNLRDIIAKNNKTYLAKVNSLNDEIDDLHQVNDPLHSHIHDLSLENDRMRNGVSMLGTTDNVCKQHRQLEDLTIRLNHVAGYLIALSFMLQEKSADSEMQKADYGTESENCFAGLTTDSAARDELREQVMRRKEAVLDSDDRDDIVQRANHFEHELRSGLHLPQRNLAPQREELSSISTTLQKLSQP